MSKPIAVLISDVHYNLTTLPLADAAMRQAIAEANSLGVPLIVAGDLHDTKANLRGECVNAMIEAFAMLDHGCYILRGNHDAINEKSKEHSLNFLKNDKIFVIEEPEYEEYLNAYLIPYQYNVVDCKKYLKTVSKGSIVIMHQGLAGSNMGDYVQDKSAITPTDVAGLRVISGHYHTRQTIQLPNGGTWDYIGNPYSLSFGEANDPEKGFQILYSDGSLEFVPTDLRRHRIVNINVMGVPDNTATASGDLIWVKSQSKLTREKIQDILGIQDFKLTYDLPETSRPEKLIGSQSQRFDALIDSQPIPDSQKMRLKQAWRKLCE